MVPSRHKSALGTVILHVTILGVPVTATCIRATCIRRHGVDEATCIRRHGHGFYGDNCMTLAFSGWCPIEPGAA